MRKTLTLLLSLFITLSVFSQAREGRAKINKTEYPVVMAEFNYPADVVTKVIENHFSDMKIGRSKGFKGYQKFEGVTVPQLSESKIDLFYKVDKKSKKESDKSIVYLAISKGYENFVSSATDGVMFQRAADMLNGLKERFESQTNQNAIDAQIKVVEKVDKDLKSLYSKGEDYKNKIKSLEKDLEKTVKEQNEKKAELEKEQKKLEELKANKK